MLCRRPLSAISRLVALKQPNDRTEASLPVAEIGDRSRSGPFETLDVFRIRGDNWPWMVHRQMLEIIPYQSVGRIEFGMTADDIIDVLGEPHGTTRNRLGETVLDHGLTRITVDDRVGAVEVALLPDAHPTLNGVDIFGSSAALNRLLLMDGAPMETLGFLVFLNLGITVTGLHDGDKSQRAATAFASGRWDRFRSELKPYSK